MALNSRKFSPGITVSPGTIPSNPENGDIYYDSTLGFQFREGGVFKSLPMVELNLVENPSEATNWSETGTVFATPVTTSTAGDLPLGGTIDTAIQFVATGNGAEASHYNSYTLTVGEGFKNRKHKVDFWMRPGTGFVSGEWTVSVYSGSTRMALSTDSSAVTTLPSATGKFTTTFDADSSSSYTLRFARTSGSGSATLNVAGVIVGPGTQPQGAVVTEWTSYTPASSWVTNTTITALRRRIGDLMEIQGTIALSGAPTAAILTIDLPSGHTMNTAAMPASGLGRLAGYAYARDASTQTYLLAPIFNDTNTITFYADGSNNEVSNTVPFTFGSGDGIHFRFQVPIAEWAGSGTLNVAQNDVEYLYNSNTATGASDTTSFAYGPSGTAFVAVSSAGATIKKRVRAQKPMGASQGKPLLEVSPDGILWMPAESQFPYLESGSDFYGMRLVAGGTAATDIDIEFGGDGANGAEAWSVYTSWRWRVSMEQPGAAVGFGLADTNSAGLVSTVNQTFAGKKRFNITGGTSLPYDSSGTTSFLTTASVNANNVPTILGNQNEASADTGLALFAGTKDGNTSGDMRFDVRENDNSAFATTTSNAFRWSVNGVDTALSTRAGAWTLGPTSGSGLVHTAQSGGNTTMKVASGGAFDAYLNLRRGATDDAYVAVAGNANAIVTGSAAGDLIVATAGSTRRILFSDTGATIGGLMTSAGLWTWGPSAGLGTTNGYHVSTGAIISKNGTNARGSYTSTDVLTLGCNHYRAGNAAVLAESTIAGYTLLDLSRTTSLGGQILGLTADIAAQTANAAVTSGVTIASATAGGAWTLGANTTLTQSRAALVYHSAGNSGDGRIRLNVVTALGDGAQGEVEVQVAGSNRAAIGVYKHSGITNSTGYLSLKQQNGTIQYFWSDDSGNFRISSTITHIGTASGTVVGTQTSDARLKDNIVAVPYGLTELMQLSAKKFNYLSDPGINELGFVAGDVQSVIPEAVYNTLDTKNGNENILAMKYHALIPVLVKALQELKTEFDDYVAAHP